jgi:hypothetical protein
MKFTCGYCHHSRADDPSTSMACRSCAADKDEPCKWSHGTSHEGRREMALYWGFDGPCAYRSGRQSHLWLETSSIMQMQNGDAP